MGGHFDPQDEILLTGSRPGGPAGNRTDGAAGCKARMTGRQLMEEGLRVRLATRPQVAWVVYRRAEGLAAMAEADRRGEVPFGRGLARRTFPRCRGTIRKYPWDLGDGTTAEGPAVQHVYRDARKLHGKTDGRGR